MLETLDEEDRAILILKYAEGYEYEELAAMFDLSTSAARCASAAPAINCNNDTTNPNPRVFPPMSNDFLDQLAAIDAPEPPPEFDRKLHQRVNRALLVQHLFGLAVGSVPWAVFHFLRAVLGAAAFSLHRPVRPAGTRERQK